ncbi:MAG: hypothetical protein KKG06_04900 [Bacteroidetes bacterium]|nr:hypothetical protein [Bacteroidota bacterium]
MQTNFIIRYLPDGQAGSMPARPVCRQAGGQAGSMFGACPTDRRVRCSFF